MELFKSVQRYKTHTITMYETEDWKVHREDGPAWIVEHDNGIRDEVWYYEGNYHRYGGPAFKKDDGSYEFWVKGIFVSPEVKEWLSERNYAWDSMNEQEKWELYLFMRTLG